MGVIITPFSDYSCVLVLVDQCQVMAKENNTRIFSSVVSGWTKLTKERHSQACLAQQ